MNETLREVKARVRRLDSVRFPDDAGMRPFLDFAQALSRVHRLLRRADRTREPTAELLASVGRAEALSVRNR